MMLYIPAQTILDMLIGEQISQGLGAILLLLFQLEIQVINAYR